MEDESHSTQQTCSPCLSINGNSKNPSNNQPPGINKRVATTKRLNIYYYWKLVITIIVVIKMSIQIQFSFIRWKDSCIHLKVLQQKWGIESISFMSNNNFPLPYRVCVWQAYKIETLLHFFAHHHRHSPSQSVSQPVYQRSCWLLSLVHVTIWLTWHVNLL